MKISYNNRSILVMLHTSEAFKHFVIIASLKCQNLLVLLLFIMNHIKRERGEKVRKRSKSVPLEKKNT